MELLVLYFTTLSHILTHQHLMNPSSELFNKGDNFDQCRSHIMSKAEHFLSQTEK